MSFSSQSAEMGFLPGGNGRKIQFGQAAFSTTDASGDLKVNLEKVDAAFFQKTGAPATDEEVYTEASAVDKGIVVGSDGKLTVTRTGASKTSGLVINYLLIGW